MPIRDVAAMNASLDNDYGTTRGPASPSSHALALFVGDPMTDGVELTNADNPGYARANVPASKWLPATNGSKSTNGPVQFANTGGEWTDEPTHWALLDGSTMWDNAPLVEPLSVTSAGTGPTVAVTVFYDDAVLSPESI